MFFNYITISVALSISAVAIYYSVAGLATIFAASVIPIIIMGSVLEVGKLVTAVWLHRNWRKSVWWLKTYLATAVVVLMFITSMGIFGYLSKSHIEQATASDEQTAKIEVLTSNIARSESKIKRWDDEIARLSSGDINNTRIDNLIKREEDALANINKAIDKEKDQYRVQATTDIDNINSKLNQYRESTNAEIQSLNEQLKTCFACDDERLAITDAKSRLSAKEEKADADIASIKKQLASDINAVVRSYSAQLDPINKRISELKIQSTAKTQDIDTRIEALETNIEKAQVTLTNSRENLSVLESNFRKLEAEVGPVKYIAEFVYGEEANRTMLEEAVRWVIVTIIFVFDPLAVLLLIASQYSFEEAHRKNNPRPTPPTTPAPPSSPPPSNNKYKDVIGKSFKGEHHPSDEPEKPKEPKTYTNLIGKTFEGGTPTPTDAEKPVVEKTDAEPKLTVKEIVEDIEETKRTIKPPVKEGTVSRKEVKKAVKKVSAKRKSAPKKTQKSPSKNEVKEALNEVNEKRAKIIGGPLKSKISDQDRLLIEDLIRTEGFDTYITYEGKGTRRSALLQMRPDLQTDVWHTVDFGMSFPENVQNGYLFLRTDFLPTKLFRYNSENWVELDKDLLREGAYSNDYIEHLIEKINEDEYNKVLLDAVLHETLGDDSVDVFNETEIKRITEFKY